MVIIRDLGLGIREEFRTLDGVGNAISDMNDSIEETFQRLVPNDYKMIHLDFSRRRFFEALEYLIDLPVNLAELPILDVDSKIQTGDLVAIRRSGKGFEVGVINSFLKTHYGVYMFPMQNIESKKIPKSEVVKLKRMNYDNEDLQLGDRVKFTSINQIITTDKNFNGIYRTQAHYGSQPHYEFYFGGKYVVGYKKSKSYAGAGPRDEFIICEPKGMAKKEAYMEMTNEVGMVSELIKKSGLFYIIRKAVESHNVSIKLKSKPLFNADEMDLLSSIYIDYMCNE